MKRALREVTRVTEFIAAMALAAIFLIFLLQIFYSLRSEDCLVDANSTNR